MAAEREPPPLGEVRPADFEELEDGEDLFTSTVSTLEVRACPRPRAPSPAVAPAPTGPSPLWQAADTVFQTGAPSALPWSPALSSPVSSNYRSGLLQ